MWYWSPTTGTTWGEAVIRHRHIDRICGGAILLALVLTGLLCFGEALGLRPASAAPGYASRLFDDGRVHTVDLRVEDWAAFLENAPAEEYIPCTAVIDGEEFYQVGLRAKGNNSLRLTEEYGLARYSLKLEFDHYVDGGNYHGLDKFSLDASFQDNSYLKTWLVYDMMDYMEVLTPLCSYVWVTVNGQPWGLFLAIEEPEDYRGQPKGDVLHYLLNKRLGAEVDYIVKGIDQEHNVVAASRLEAMALKRREYYFRTDRDGTVVFVTDGTHLTAPKR